MSPHITHLANHHQAQRIQATKTAIERVLEMAETAIFLLDDRSIPGDDTAQEDQKNREAIQHIREAYGLMPEMTGFMATLTPDQVSAAMAYCGDDTNGPIDYANI